MKLTNTESQLPSKFHETCVELDPLENPENLGIELASECDGPTAIACYVGIRRSRFIKRVAKYYGIDVVNDRDALCSILELAVAFRHQNVIDMGDQGALYPEISPRPFKTLVIACDLALERDFLIHVLPGIQKYSGIKNIVVVYLREANISEIENRMIQAGQLPDPHY
jgi:hypothetical protein